MLVHLLQAGPVSLGTAGRLLYFLHGVPPHRRSHHQPAGRGRNAEEREALTEELGFNKSVPLQYLHYVGKVLQGDLGISYRLKRPVADIIAERLPATLELALTAAVFALLIGVVLGCTPRCGAKAFSAAPS
jgi:ABC-type dipeptide/oligopeptide/nickel transport system permease component